MPSGTRSRTAIAGIAGVAALALMTAGCSSSKSSAPSSPAPATTTSAAAAASSSASGATDAAAIALLPAAVKSKGSLVIAADATYAPNESTDDSNNIVGYDVDLGKAIAAKLGMTANFQNVTFDNILGGIQGGKYDMGMSSMTDNKDREGKGFDFVDYFNAGTKVMVASGNPENITSNGATDLSLCGKKVGVESTTIQETDDIPARNKACEAAGKPDITKVAQEKQSDVNTSLQSGRVDAVLADSPVVDYAAKTNGFTAVGDAYEGAPYGIAIWKATDDGLAQAVLQVLKDMQADGSYAQLAAKYGIQSGDLQASGFVINGATS